MRRQRAVREGETIPPQCRDAEVQLLGALIQDRALAQRLAENVSALDFYEDRHARIFSAIRAVLSQDIPLDLVSLGEELSRRDQLPAVGGTSYLAWVVDATPTTANADYHARLVREKAGLRRIAEACTRATERARSNGTDPGKILVDLWEETRQLDGSGDAASKLPALEAPVAVLRKLRDQGDPVPTGIAALDERTRGGMRPGKALVIGGTAGAGKTALAVQVVRAGAGAGCVVACLMADEGREPAIIRLGQQLGYERDALEAVDHPGHEATLAALERDLAGLDIFFPDPDADGDVTLEGTVEALVQAYPGRRKVVVVDSIQTVPTRQIVREVPSLRERIMGNARLARALAVEHGLVMIYTSEFNRSWYRARKEEDRTSDLAAFAEARIEFSGDVLLAMRAMDEDPDLVKVTVPKNRLGTRQPFMLRLDRARARFEAVDGDLATTARCAAETQRIDEAREAILRELTAHSGVTRRQLQELVGIKVGVFSDALKGLKADGMVQTVPKGTAVLHSLTEVPK